MKKISTWQLILLSTGGMIGSGWLFSPYYGFQTAGVGVLISWFLTALLSLIIGLAFAEVASILPIVGGVMRFIGVTHSRALGFLFVVLGWVSYVVYLPLEAQSAIQYLGFWVPALVQQTDKGVSLSMMGLFAAFAVMLFLTWFNTQHLTRVAKANSIVSIWKIIIPLSIAIGMIIVFGNPSHIVNNHNLPKLAFEPILLAITSSGLAFAFSGFQNGLIIANSAENPRRAIPLSIIAPVIIGWVMYSALSLMFMFCLPSEKYSMITGVAPLLGLLSLFGLHYIYVILFVDAIIAPLGTANVFTTVTGKILFGLGREFFPKSLLVKVNKFSAPVIALWINMVVGVCFLLPFPTWTELVNFLSSLVLLSCLSGPLALIILRDKFPELERKFKVPFPRLLGYLGFASCSFFVYWSGMDNLYHLVWLILLVCVCYWLIFARKNALLTFVKTWFLFAYILALYAISYFHNQHLISFPEDNYLVFAVSIVFAKIFLMHQARKEVIAENIVKLREELARDN